MIKSNELERLLENAYESLSDVNWYGFRILINKEDELIWFQIASDNEVSSYEYNMEFSLLYTIYNVDIYTVDEAEACEYIDESVDIPDYVEITEDELNRIYLLYKNEYEDKNEFDEEYIIRLDDLLEVNYEKADKVIKEVMNNLQNEYEEENSFIKMTIKEKASYIISKYESEK